MSATIILIMTSSSTRNTEPPGGRDAVMVEFLSPNPNQKYPRASSQITFVCAMSALSRLREQTRSKAVDFAPCEATEITFGNAGSQTGVPSTEPKGSNGI